MRIGEQKSRRDGRPRGRRHAGYLIALVTPFLALAAHKSLSALLGESAPFTTPLFIVPAILASAIAGLWPGLLAAALSLAVADYYVLEPAGSFSISRSDDLVRAGMLLTLSLLITFLNEALHRTRRRLKESRVGGIAERRKAEEKLRRYELIAEYSRDIVLLIRHDDGRIIEANAAAIVTYGYSRQELLSLSIGDLRSPDARSSLASEMAAAEAGGILFETIHMRKDRSTFPAEVSSQAVTVGGVRTLISVVRDITERKSAEQKIRATLESITDGFASFDREWRYTYVNKTGARISGKRREELIGKRLWDVFPQAVNSRSYRENLRAMESNTSAHYEEYYPEPFDIWLECHAYPSPDGLSIFFRDITEQKRTREEARRSRMLLSEAERLSHTGAWEWDVQSDRWQFSDEWLKIHGTEKSSLSRDELILISHPDDRETVRRAFREVASGEKAYEIEHRIIRQDTGETRVVRANGQFVRDPSGRVARVYGFVQDITEQKEAEWALRRSEERLRRFYDSGLLGVIYWTTRGRITAANDKFLQMIGYTREDLEADRIDWEHMTPPEYRHLDEHALRELRESGVDTPYEKEYIRKDGSRVPIIIGAAMLQDPPDEGVAFVLDITERKRIELELRKSYDEMERRVQERTAQLKRQADLLDHSHDAILVRDLEGHIIFWSRGAQEEYGWSREEALGRISHELLNTRFPKDREEIEAEVRARGRWEGEVKQTTRDGRELIVASRWAFQVEEGVPVGYLEINSNITEQKRTEEQLRQAQKMEALGTLAGGIAHDFNNMLSAILGNAELALEDLDEHPPSRNIRQIVKASERAADLVRQILAFSRKSETGRSPLHLTSLLKETFKLLRSTIPSTIRMGLKIGTQKDTVLADPSQIQQIIMNLCTNAAHAMREKGGTLTVAMKEAVIGPAGKPDPDMAAGDYVEIVVRDTGTGMTEDVRQRIFEPFFTTKGPGIGTGMGLAVVYGIVKSHGGAIIVDTAPGAGSTFAVYLPYARVEAKEEETEQGEVPRGRERILLVDDEPEVAESAAQTLERLGYRVTSTVDPREAWSLFQKERDAFDLVITDQAMPDISGIDLAERMMKARKDLPVILFTGYSEVISPERVKEAGISELMTKPAARREVAETVRRVLDKKAAK